MGSVLSKIDDHEFEPVPACAGVTTAGDVRCRRVVDGDGRPIHLWMHRMAPGASIVWDRPVQDHAIYVWEGRAFAGRDGISADEAYIVEHGGRGVLEARYGPVQVLHFHRPEAHPEPAMRKGGHAHVLAGAAIRRGLDVKNQVGRSLFADASCPTCAVWLHGNQLPFGEGADPHYHNEDEVIVVTAGAMKLGRIAHSRGTVLAIDRQTRYAFKVGERGLSYINFRPSPPVMFMDGRPPQDERARLLKALSRSVPVSIG